MSFRSLSSLSSPACDEAIYDMDEGFGRAVMVKVPEEARHIRR